MSNKPDTVNSSTYRFLDSGIDTEPYPDREFHFRIGWLSTLLACFGYALEAESVGELKAYLRHRCEVAELARTKARRIVENDAARIGKKNHRMLFVDQHHYRQRYFRGKHHAVVTIERRVDQFLSRHRTATVDDLRGVLRSLLGESIRWALNNSLSGNDDAAYPPDARLPREAVNA